MMYYHHNLAVCDDRCYTLPYILTQSNCSSMFVYSFRLLCISLCFAHSVCFTNFIPHLYIRCWVHFMRCYCGAYVKKGLCHSLKYTVGLCVPERFEMLLENIYLLKYGLNGKYHVLIEQFCSLNKYHPFGRHSIIIFIAILMT